MRFRSKNISQNQKNLNLYVRHLNFMPEKNTIFNLFLIVLLVLRFQYLIREKSKNVEI